MNHHPGNGAGTASGQNGPATSPDDRTVLERLDKMQPIEALIANPDGVLALVTGVAGPSYRAPGAMMAIWPDAKPVGRLSSGCIEADLAIHAKAALRDGKLRVLRYGAGSPYRDIVLPCGGGLQVTLFPRPDPSVLRDLSQVNRRRATATLHIGRDGALFVTQGSAVTTDSEAAFVYRPEPQFVIFGEGPETAAFSALVHSIGYRHITASNGDAAMSGVARPGETLRHAPDRAFPLREVDENTAVLFFFHDHDRELPIIKAALRTPAFYLGAQGSRRAHANRVAALTRDGIPAAQIARIHGPIGLIHSARDPRILAVSVLAEVLARDPNTGPIANPADLSA
ncbi:XdhC family protein [Paracoccus pacificus]|uniref:XdhC family protein n=1 Tax=Paracoccus pacificus TaxID=1463598 RepID=A0ABW4RBN8_9RHOB